MCSTTEVNLQRGMNFRLRNVESIIPMSLRPGAPYPDRVEDDDRTLVYEGHDVPKTLNGANPKEVGQPDHNRSVTFTQNRLFAEANLWVQERRVAFRGCHRPHRIVSDTVAACVSDPDVAVIVMV
jgi:hypothetical protein